MFKTAFVLLLTLFLSINLTAADTAKDKYKMFPEANEGYTRYIVDVPKTQNDYDHKVELLIGKNIMVDCNHASLSATIKKSIERLGIQLSGSFKHSTWPQHYDGVS